MYRSVVLSIVVWTLASTVAFAGEIKRTSRPIPEAYFVWLKDDVIDVAGFAENARSKHSAKVVHIIERVLKGVSLKLSEVQASRLADDPRVKGIYEVPAAYPTAVQSPAPSWGLDRIDQQSLPLNNEYNYGTTGAGVVVYVLDSGIANVYQEFGGRVIRQRNFARRPDQTVNSLDVLDYRNHGTSVASIIGGNTYGVAKGVQFVNLKVFGYPDEQAYTDDVISAIDWMVADHQTYGDRAVANYSGMAPVRFAPLEEAVVRAINSGITFVVSAGNNARDACLNTPAALGDPTQWPSNPNGHSTITVGSMTASDAMVIDSAFGPCVDIYAPGENVSAMGSSGQQTPFGGTSAAAPYVAGVAARHLEAYPTATPGVIQSTIKDHGTAQMLSGLGANSFNLLLYSGIVRRRACCAYP